MAKKKKKKISRKQLLNEPDEFITFSSKLLKFIIDHKNQITIVVSVIFCLLVAFSGWRYFSNKAEDKASISLEQSIARYQSAKMKEGATKAYLAVEKEFQLLLKKYSGKHGGKLARVIFANICYDAGKADEAIALYEKSLKDFAEQPFIRNMILNSLGYACEKKGDFADAIRYFEMTALGPQPDLKNEAWYNLGRIYSREGDIEKSLQAYQKIADDFKNSMYFDLVREKLAYL
ncbi:MAG: tetratricopeptide repeat protein [Thermodesulfobacteriota bacterium]|nr:tetratricopeptide repeat protein [Thermodesulfobacteriota bacterium]